MFTINLYSNFALLQRWTQLSASQGGTAQQRIADVPRMGPVRFLFRTGGYPWCCQNGHFGVPWTKWGEGRKKNFGGCSRRKCLKCRDFGVDSLESHGRHLLDVVYICSIDPLHLCRARKPWVLGLAGATCTWRDQAAIRDWKKRKLVGKGRSWTEVAKKSVTREAEWSKASQSPHLLGCTPQHPWVYDTCGTADGHKTG